MVGGALAFMELRKSQRSFGFILIFEFLRRSIVIKTFRSLESQRPLQTEAGVTYRYSLSRQRS